MRQALEAELEREFLFMRNITSGGCDCGGGWYELLRGLCWEISTVYQEAGVPVDIVVDQVKEKFGGLRFYYHVKAREHGDQASGFLDGPGLSSRPEGMALHRKVAEIVSRWEEKSYTVCETCGKPGEPREDLPWTATLCDSCYTRKRNG